MGSVPLAIVAVAYLFVAGWGAGRLLRLLCRGAREFDISHEIVFVVAGLHVVGVCGVSLGMMGGLAGSRALILLSVFTVIGIGEAFRSGMSSHLVGNVRRLWDMKPSPSWIVAVPFLLLTLGPAMNYPTGWDELVYHSVLPRRWLADGWPRFYVDIPYSGFPSFVEILCWLVAPIESLIVSRLLIWVSWILSLVLAFRVIGHRTDGWTAKWLVMAMAASPISLMISANCYVEAFQLLDILAILVLLDDLSRSETASRSIAPFVLIGILVGGCAAIKLTGVIILILPVAWYSINRMTDKHTMTRFPIYVGTVGLCAIVTAIPFYARAWMLAGNPFYPYFAEWFTNAPAILDTSFYHHAIGADAFGMRGAIGFASAPILIAWDNALFDGMFGWQWIVLVGLVVLSFKNIRSKQGVNELVWFGTASLILYSFWFFSAQQARFALPWYLTMILLACSGLRELKGRMRTLFGVLLVGTTVVSLPWTNAGYYLASWERLLGIWSHTQYVDDSLEVEYVPLIDAIEKHTPINARLFLLFEHRSLYIPRECVIGTPFFQAEGLTPPEPYSDPDRLLHYLSENKCTHMVLATKLLGPDRSGNWWNRGDSVFSGIEKGVKSGTLKIVWTSDCYVLLGIGAFAKP